jgi:hypothetical protein
LVSCAPPIRQYGCVALCPAARLRTETGDDAFKKASVLADLPTSRRIARWAYEQLDATQGLTWERADTLVPLDTGWRTPPGLAA